MGPDQEICTLCDVFEQLQAEVKVVSSGRTQLQHQARGTAGNKISIRLAQKCGFLMKSRSVFPLEHLKGKEGVVRRPSVRRKCIQ